MAQQELQGHPCEQQAQQSEDNYRRDESAREGKVESLEQDRAQQECDGVCTEA